MLVHSSARLVLSSLTARDAQELFEIRGDPVAMQYWDWPHDASPEVTESVVQTMLAEMAAGEAHYWTVRLRQGEQFVAVCDLRLQEGEQSAEIGFMFVRSRWGAGLAKEVVNYLCEHARRLGLKTLNARIHCANERSERLLLRAGFEELATAKLEIRPGVFRLCKRLELAL